MDNKVVLITGASEGIGAACARQLRKKGAKLSLTARPGPGFEDHSDSHELVFAGDITDDGFRRTLVRRTVDQFGRIDVLINNVGVGLCAPPSTVDVELSKRMFDINIFAPLALTQLIIPDMRTRGSGTIVNLGSVGGRVSLPWSVMYCATKFAVHAVNDSLRRELSNSGIRVVKVCPGIVDTKFRDNVLAGEAPGPVSRISRVVSAEQLARAIVSGIESGARTVYVPPIARAFMALESLSSTIMDLYVRRQW
jgi:short-subunit dehydrogenase